MNDLRGSLKKEFADEDARYAYAQSFLNTKIAAQIKTLREQREKTQDEIALECGTKQAGFSRFEDVNHSVWKTDTLWKIARALGVRVNISFETFGSLLDEKERFNREALRRPKFEEDPTFSEALVDVHRAAARELLGASRLRALASGGSAGIRHFGASGEQTARVFQRYCESRPTRTLPPEFAEVGRSLADIPRRHLRIELTPIPRQLDLWPQNPVAAGAGSGSESGAQVMSITNRITGNFGSLNWRRKHA